MNTPSMHQNSKLQNRTEQGEVVRGNRINLLRNLLNTEAPNLHQLAKIGGTWVWIACSQQQSHSGTIRLTELGFYWNGNRQASQHSCGIFRDKAASFNLREYYGGHYASHSQPA